MNTKATIKGSARWLVSGNLLDAALAEQACASASEKHQSVVKYLVEQEILESKTIASSQSQKFGYPLLDLDAMDPLTMPLAMIDSSLIQKHRVLPLYKRNTTLFLGTSDPANLSTLEEIKFHTGCKIELIIIEEEKLQTALQDLLEEGSSEPALKQGIDYLDSQSQVFGISGEEINISDESLVDETPVMRFVNKILIDAIRNDVSDIHIEPYDNSSRIRFREDGLLREISKPPGQICRRICSRLKVMAKLNISEKRVPQDGRFKLKLTPRKSIDFRVSTLPTLWGEKVVLRVLDPGKTKLDLDSLGFTDDQKQHYLDALNRQQGLILVTGPTGSGKSLSLYAGLSLLNTQERNIATAEDPVEIQLEGINQVAINPGVGLGFADSLRAFMRQDPDVLMVGEIRDLETAEIAIRASQTGHLVLSTLHTNNASETISRLIEMGIAPYHLASTLSLVVAQRLLRRLCNRCKKTVKLPTKVLIQEGFSRDHLDNLRLFTPAGCDHCLAGYKGRLGIYETVPITEAISHDIINGGNSTQIAELANKAGFNNLRQSALEKVALGLTSLAEVNRIT